MYVLIRTVEVVPGFEIMSQSSSGGFSAGVMDDEMIKRFGHGEGLWMEEVTKEEANALGWLWAVNSRRFDDGQNVGNLVKVYPTDEDWVNALSIGKKVRKKENADIYAKKFAKLRASVNPLEEATFAAQLAEAQAYTANPNAKTPVIDVLLKGRSLSKSELVNNIINAATKYNIKVAALLNQQQINNDKIDACKSVDELYAIKPENM